MYKIKILFISLLFFGFIQKVFPVYNVTSDIQNITFNVVEKKLLISENLPEHLLNLVNNWFNNRVKVNGFDGKLIITIHGFKQKISLIEDGKRVDVSMKFTIETSKSSLSQKKVIDGEVFSYSSMTGVFSLNEFEETIENTQSDLIIRLVRNLKSKI